MIFSSGIIFLVLTIFPGVELFDCPFMSSCDCKQDTDRQDGTTKSYSLVLCEEDFESVLNLSSFRNINIETLRLKNTSLSNIESDSFIDLKVETVEIVDSNAVIGENAFTPIKSTLKTLSLINANQLLEKALNLEFLKGLTELTSLVLDKSATFPFHFPKNVFKHLHLTSLLSLSLRHCGIAKMADSALAGLPNLEILDLSYNNISAVPVAILELKNLHTLKLSHNQKLYYIHEHAFITLTKLQEIDLSYSGLDIIYLNAFTGLENSLEILKLGHGKLEDGHFSLMEDLEKLKYLDISYNKIVEVHNTSFERFQAPLEELDMSGQFDIRDGIALRLNFIDSMFRGIESKLKILRISDLGLMSLPLATLYPLKQLTLLDASKNDFTEIYENFFDGILAKTINLTDCGISEISSAAFENMILSVEIIFDRNNITNISFIADTRPCLFHKLSFLENPVNCNCEIIDIVSGSRVQQLIGTCGANGLYRGVAFRNLNKLKLAKSTCAISNSSKVNNCSHFSVGLSPDLRYSLLSYSLIVCLYAFLFMLG